MNLAKSLKIESVSRLQPRPPLCLPPATPVAEAVAALRRERVSCLLVCEHGKLSGLFTERDLLRRILAAGKPLSLSLRECMTANPVVVRLKDSIGTAIARMEKGGYRHLPVVDEEGHPVGILSVKQIVHYLVEYFAVTVYNLPPDASATAPRREGA